MNPTSVWGDMNMPKKEYSLQAVSLRSVWQMAIVSTAIRRLPLTLMTVHVLMLQLGELRVEVKASKVVFITVSW